MCMVRNSVGSNAYVADEIITSRAGVRIRIGNTDAEGRMAMSDVLCKVLFFVRVWFTRQRGQKRPMSHPMQVLEPIDLIWSDSLFASWKRRPWMLSTLSWWLLPRWLDTLVWLSVNLTPSPWTTVRPLEWTWPSSFSTLATSWATSSKCLPSAKKTTTSTKVRSGVEIQHVPFVSLSREPDLLTYASVPCFRQVRVWRRSPG